jgi:hypothetical protein
MYISYITPTTKVEDMFGNLFYRTSLEFWKTSTLNYTFYWLLAVFLGFFGADMLYLRSPWMMIAKFMVNLFTFGYWWIYDAVEATFNKTQVQLVGPSAPFYGPLGIAGGQFMGAPGTQEQLDKHYTFALYTIVVCIGGIFGADSFLVGDKMSGWIRLISLVTIIFAPVALLWWAYKMFMLWFQTGSVIDQEYKFFGAPKPANADDICPNVFEHATYWIIHTLSAIPGLGFLKIVADKLAIAYGIVKNTIQTVREDIPILVAATEGNIVVKEPEAKKALEELKKGAASAPQKGGGVSLEDIELTGKSMLLVFILGAILTTSLSVSAWRVWKNGSSSSEPKDDERSSEKNDDPPEPAHSGAAPSE